MNAQQWLLLTAAVLGGVLLAFLAIYPLAILNWANLLIWAAGCVGLGLAPGTRTSKAIRLGAFGFTLGFAFMCFGYRGAEPLATRVIPFALIGLFCSICAIAVGGIVHLVKGRVAKA